MHRTKCRSYPLRICIVVSFEEMMESEIKVVIPFADVVRDHRFVYVLQHYNVIFMTLKFKFRDCPFSFSSLWNPPFRLVVLEVVNVGIRSLGVRLELVGFDPCQGICTFVVVVSDAV